MTLGTLNHRGGIGQVSNAGVSTPSVGPFQALFSPTQAQSSACPNPFTRFFNYADCQSAGSPGASLPLTSVPSPPATTQGTSATPPTGYTASYAGTDSTGQDIYTYVPDANTLQAQNTAAITAATAAALTAAQAAANQPQPVDCTSEFNYLFSSQCPVNCNDTFSGMFNSTCGTPWGLYALLGVGALVAFSAVKKGRR